MFNPASCLLLPYLRSLSSVLCSEERPTTPPDLGCITTFTNLGISRTENIRNLPDIRPYQYPSEYPADGYRTKANKFFFRYQLKITKKSSIMPDIRSYTKTDRISNKLSICSISRNIIINCWNMGLNQGCGSGSGKKNRIRGSVPRTMRYFKNSIE